MKPEDVKRPTESEIKDASYIQELRKKHEEERKNNPLPHHSAPNNPGQVKIIQQGAAPNG
eukprot:CAMPEP_0114582180 /NCGR_PEP_ID=MMETSP0125-20121206/6204_1 /TAXON_ID=485358 ORGANISM="Aristerostoma sp., Strain ATCC 50986" /NCGR_SAMPLE_ID=MMETSP0125 /ASSEMBLY_ACC=CAM_ASM_000245 /LENGTH=59 /DNA_ID=CAMNT_0001774961 /DNA_START=524 /DNA_END=703 /DNA_ORIENTATION=-